MFIPGFYTQNPSEDWVSLSEGKAFVSISARGCPKKVFAKPVGVMGHEERKQTRSCHRSLLAHAELTNPAGESSQRELEENMI